MALLCENADAARASLYRQYKYEIEWVSESNYGPGSYAELRVSNIRTLVSWVFMKWYFNGGEIVYRFPAYPNLGNDDVFTNANYAVVRARLTNGVRRGEKSVFTLYAIPHIFAGVNAKFTLWAEDSSFNRQDGETGYAMEPGGLTLVCNPGPVEKLKVYSRPAARGGKVRIVVTPEDRYGNPSAFEKPVTAKLRLLGAEREITVEKPTVIYMPEPGASALAELYVNASCLSPREDISNAETRGDSLVVYGNPVLPAGCEGLCDRSGKDFMPAFGEFHWHCEFSSDGDRTIREGFEYARDALNLDCASTADHNTRGAAWEETVAASDEADSDEFTTLFGWENASNRGHENYYFKDPAHPLVCGGGAGITAASPENSSETLEKYGGFIAVPHHTNATAETLTKEGVPYWFQYALGKPLECYRLIEVFQCRGNFEADDMTDEFRSWHQRNGASVRDFLKAGYKVGFTGGTDNHCAYPGRSWAESEMIFRSDLPVSNFSLTGIWVGEHTREGLFEALYARRTWAVWDTRAVACMSVNGVVQGGETTAAKNAELNFKIRIEAEKPFRSVEIIHNGETVMSESCASRTYAVEKKLTADESGYYYARAVLRGGGLVYISPVFVKVI